MAAIWVVFGHSEVISNIEKWSADIGDSNPGSWAPMPERWPLHHRLPAFNNCGWNWHVRQSQYGRIRWFESFPTLCDFLATCEDNISEEIKRLFIQHLQSFKIIFRDYFPPHDANNKWIRDPFHVYVKHVKKLTAKEGNSLVELSCDTSLRSRFSRYDLINRLLVTFEKWVHRTGNQSLKIYNAILYYIFMWAGFLTASLH